MRSQLRSLGFGHSAKRDPGEAVRTYHEGLCLTLELGTFYFGGDSNFLFWCNTESGRVGERERERERAGESRRAERRPRAIVTLAANREDAPGRSHRAKSWSHDEITSLLGQGGMGIGLRGNVHSLKQGSLLENNQEIIPCHAEKHGVVPFHPNRGQEDERDAADHRPRHCADVGPIALSHPTPHVADGNE